jgi:hypothetical protein
VTGHEVVVTATLRKRDGNPLTGKLLGVTVNSALVTVTVDPSDGKTNNAGELKITVRRQSTPFVPTDTVDAVVRVSLGLVITSTTVRL